MSQKILIFSTSYLPFVGGAEVAIKEITDRLPDIQFDLITGRFDSKLKAEERIGNVNVYRIGIGIPILDKLLLPFLGAIKTLQLDSKNHYATYWCIMVTWASGAAYIANILRFWRKVPIILNLQEGDSEDYLRTRRFGLVGLSTRLALKKSDKVTVISSYLGQRAKQLGFKGEPILVPNGVDTERFSKEIPEDERNEIRKSLNLRSEDLALITSSRLVKKNGVGDVIKALALLSPNIKFVVCGEGELKSDLQKLAKDLKVSDRVLFKGLVSHDDLPKFLKACDVFVRPSLSEGMGLSFVEAFAARIPVVATRVGGIVDFLEEGQTGYVCEPEKPKSVAEAVSRCLKDPNKNTIVANAHDLVVEKYDWNLIAKQMREIFDNTINRHG